MQGKTEHTKPPLMVRETTPFIFDLSNASHMFIFLKIYLTLNFSKNTQNPDNNRFRGVEHGVLAHECKS